MEKWKNCEDSCKCDPNLNELGGDYSMSKTTRKEKVKWYGICANNNPPEQTLSILRDALSHMGEATVYWAAAEAQYRFNNDFGRRVDALVTGIRS